MARPLSEHPTELELAILKILWQKSPQTVETVREALAGAGRDLTYSSVITMLNIMVRKKYLQRVKRGRAFEYEPLVLPAVVGPGRVSERADQVKQGPEGELPADHRDGP